MESPDPSWTPTTDFIANTNLAWLMNQVGVDTYAALHDWSVQHRAAYWEAAIKRLGIRFQRSYEQLLDLSEGVENPHWLTGARLNIVESCFAAPPDSPAILHQSEGGALHSVTVGELNRLVSQVSASLTRRGFRPGDALAIYLPMPEPALQNLRRGRGRLPAAHRVKQGNAPPPARPLPEIFLTTKDKAMSKMSNPIRTILITGAGSGLGRGLALCLAREGHSILATDRNLGGAQETVAQIESLGGQAHAHALDVTSEDDITHLLGALSGRTRIDVLVNNAGLQQVSPIEEFPIQKWDLLVDVILKGAFLMTRAVLPGMREAGFGRIVQIGSIHSLVASPYKSAYVAAKHALIGFSKTVALETAADEITVNTVCPAYIRTPLVDQQIADQARTRGLSEDEVIERVMLAPMPKKAFITFEEIAAAVEYLISPLARNVTGQTVTIDGGWTAQ